MIDRIDLPPEPRSAAAARRWSRDVLAQRGQEPLVETVELLVSELVTNVVLHARTPCTLQVEVNGRVHVEVLDGDGQLPEPQAALDPLAPSGRGLLLVAALSSAHGAEPLPGGGKRVWFELPLA